MVFNHALVAVGDKDDILYLGTLGFFHHVLDNRLVVDGQHFLGDVLGCWQGAGAPTGHRNNNLANVFHTRLRLIWYREDTSCWSTSAFLIETLCVSIVTLPTLRGKKRGFSACLRRGRPLSRPPELLPFLMAVRSNLFFRQQPDMSPNNDDLAVQHHNDIFFQKSVKCKRKLVPRKVQRNSWATSSASSPA